MVLISLITVGILSPCPTTVEVPSDLGSGAYLGTSVAIDGGRAVAGAPLDTGLAWAAGAVYVYRWINEGWEIEARLIADDGAVGDMLGVDVDIQGDTIIAGAWFNDHAGSNSGAAYIFELASDGNWYQEAKITAPDASPEDAFGRTVSLGTDFCAIGSPLDDDLGPTSGSILIFDKNGDGTWSFAEKLLTPSGSEGDELGLSLAVDGQRVLGGAPWAHDGRGEIHLWERFAPGQSWVHTWFMTMASAGSPDDYFGFSLALEGDRMAAGSYRDDTAGDDAGCIWTMERVFDGWLMQQHFPPSPNAGGQFGVSLALSGDLLLVGSRFGMAEGIAAGSVDVLVRSDAIWTPAYVLPAPDPVAEAEYGWALDVDGDLALVGALEQPASGAVCGWRGLTMSCDCVGDIDDDGTVGVDDLLGVLENWGSDGAGDVDDSGTVDVDDLLLLIASWGACP